MKFHFDLHDVEFLYKIYHHIFFWGYIGLIDNIINLIKKETRKSFKLVITGGYSDLFRKSLKTRVIQNKDITIKGLIKIAKLIK